MSGASRATLAVKSQFNLKPIHDMTTRAQTSTQGNPRIYPLKPELKFQPQADRAVTARVQTELLSLIATKSAMTAERAD